MYLIQYTGSVADGSIAKYGDTEIISNGAFKKEYTIMIAEGKLFVNGVFKATLDENVYYGFRPLELSISITQVNNPGVSIPDPEAITSHTADIYSNATVQHTNSEGAVTNNNVKGNQESSLTYGEEAIAVCGYNFSNDKSDVITLPVAFIPKNGCAEFYFGFKEGYNFSADMKIGGITVCTFTQADYKKAVKIRINGDGTVEVNGKIVADGAKLVDDDVLFGETGLALSVEMVEAVGWLNYRISQNMAVYYVAPQD